MNADKNNATDKIVGSSDGLEPGWLRRQIQQASESVRKLKRHSPYIFPEWQELQQAKDALQKAQKQYAAASKRWKDLGSNVRAEPPP